MSLSSQKRSEDFLKISSQFKLGALVTESSHPVTANLSEVAKQDVTAALKLLFDVDEDVVKTFREFVASGRAATIKEAVLCSLNSGGRIFFTGCGSTGRLSILLDSIWRDFWQLQREGKLFPVADYEQRTFSVMAGGDFALIKSVEGFEDFTAFGKNRSTTWVCRQKILSLPSRKAAKLRLSSSARRGRGVEAGAKVYFVYNNPDNILCETVERSREVIQDSRIEKINLTTGPMAIMGSTRMQATSIQLIVMLTILEMVVREMLGLSLANVPEQSLKSLTQMLANLKSPELLTQLAELVVHLRNRFIAAVAKNNYFAEQLAIDVLTDTTERSPTYCTPPFRKFDDSTASESWAYLFLPQNESANACMAVIDQNAKPRCVEWRGSRSPRTGRRGKLPALWRRSGKITCAELMRFRIGQDGRQFRPLKESDGSVAVVARMEIDSFLQPRGFYHAQFEAAQKIGARTGLIHFGTEYSIRRVRDAITGWAPECISVMVPLPETDLLLDGVKRTGVKLLLNTLSTCTMVRLGRVMGNTMIWVVPSNLKLIDRATRYIVQLTSLSYEAANELLFEIIEYVEPRMKTDQAYPPVVGMAVLRTKQGLTNEEAEKQLMSK